MITIFINLIALALIGFIVWWFIFSKPKAAHAKGNILNIRIHDGIYDPSTIKVKKGETLHMEFFREDESPCSETVIFDKLNLSRALPLMKSEKIVLTIKDAGVYDFTCQMGMYRGQLIVE